MITDDHTRYVWVYILKRKNDAYIKFCEWKTMAEKAHGKSLKALRTDDGGEFTSIEFEEMLKKNGIKHELTVPKCPPQNGVAERLNRTLMEMVRSMISCSGLPQSFWAEALSTATYIKNRSPTKSISMTPYEALTGN
jgi:transposase InsO family protein